MILSARGTVIKVLISLLVNLQEILLYMHLMLPDWKSSLIIRVPQDPLHPQNQIWLYYTHLADLDGNTYIVADFPAGTSDLFVEEGTLLGYQGNFSGTIGKPVGVHLHFSIVMDDGNNNFLNELAIHNTLDPSPYFDLPLNGKSNQGIIPVCQNQLYFF